MVSYLQKHFFRRKKRGINFDLQLQFLKRLERLLRNGYPLIEALDILTWDRKMTDSVETIKASLQAGHPVDQAFEHAMFHETITSYLYFVRMNGDLPTSLRKCIHIGEQRLKYLTKFIQVIRYPLVLLIIFLTLLFFIKQSVLPSFVDLFHSSSQASSTVMFSIMIIDLFVYIVIMSALGLLLISIMWLINKTKLSIETQLKIYSKIPIIRSYLRMQTSLFFATHMSMFLKTGMSIKDVLKKMSEQRKLSILSYYTNLMMNELSRGFYMTSLLAELRFLDKRIATIFHKNADANDLEKDLTAFADLLMEEMENKIMKMITIIQPLFFIILACFIIFIYVTLMWPMFQLIKTM